MKNSDFWQPRSINPLLGKQPQVGVFSYYQVVPCAGLGILSLVLSIEFSQFWVLWLVLWLSLSLIYLIVMGDKPWLTISRTIAVPNPIVVGLRFRWKK